jgi:hypothetical protein
MRKSVKWSGNQVQGRRACRAPVRMMAVAAVIAGSLSGPACNLSKVVDPIVNSTNAAVAAIDDATSKITAVSGSWQQVLQGTLTQLTGDAQSTVRNEIQTLLDNSIAAVQVGVQCTVDFVGRRVLQVLQEIKAELLGSTAPTPQPFVCSSAPTAVEFAAWQQNRVPTVTLTGFDLKVPLQVQLVQTTGTTTVPNVLAEISPYQASINLGATGLKLTPQTQRISVQTTATPPVELSAINVVQPQPVICVEKDISPEFPSPISFVPQQLTQGDGEFDGHGPHIALTIDLFPINSDIHYSVAMNAIETGGDHTSISGSGSGILSLSPPLPSGFAILAINGPATSSADYTDTNNTDDHVKPTNGGPVSEFVFVGDTDSSDFGKTQLKSATFNAIGLHVFQTANCVPAAQAKALVNDAHTTPELANHLRQMLAQ